MLINGTLNINDGRFRMTSLRASLIIIAFRSSVVAWHCDFSLSKMSTDDANIVWRLLGAYLIRVRTDYRKFRKLRAINAALMILSRVRVTFSMYTWQSIDTRQQWSISIAPQWLVYNNWYSGYWTVFLTTTFQSFLMKICFR